MSDNSSGDFLEFEGLVESVIRDQVFVRVNENYKVICTLSGKIRMSGIKILPFDRVKIMVSPYDTSRGRIVYRLKSD